MSLSLLKGRLIFNDKFLDKALEYQALRTTPGYFQGAMWNDKIDKWGGRKHTLMQDFEDIFAKNKYPVTMLIGLLGEPDEFVTLSHELFNVIQSVPQFSRQEEYKSGNFFGLLLARSARFFYFLKFMMNPLLMRIGIMPVSDTN